MVGVRIQEFTREIVFGHRAPQAWHPQPNSSGGLDFFAGAGRATEGSVSIEKLNLPLKGTGLEVRT